MAHRKNRAPMSELSQLRVLRALDEAQASSQKGGPIMAGVLAQAKGLAPRTVAALALHHNPDVRSLLFRNKTIGPETLAQAWPQGMGTLDEYLEKYKNTPYEDQDSPIPDLARAIRDRKAYAQRRATEHLIRPWPKGLAKSEGDWFPLQLREWLSSRGKEEVHQGYYYRAPNLDVARQLIKDKFLPVEPTDEILDGQVVWAYPAKDAYYHQWEEDPSAGGVLIYLETDEEPIYHDSRVFWPHDVAMTTARIAGIRPQNLQKGERPFTKRDLDPSLGYSISSKPHQSGVEVLAHDHTGNLVGRAVVGPYEDGRFIPHIVKVDPAHQRKGIASAMYSHAEKVTGQKLHPSPMQSEAVEAMWAAPRKFGKSEIDPGPTFNGEKDYRPDEAGDPQFPFQGGSRKEHSEPLEAILPLPGTNLEPGEHRTALAQLGHDEHLEAVLAAACFLGKKPYDPELLRQGLAVWGSKERAALHSVGLADSERNLRALDAVVKLQGGKAESRPLHKSEPEGIRSVIPCNEDGKDTAEAILRGVQSGNVTKLALKGKHSAGSLAIRDPHTGKVWLVKGSGGKQSPAQGARDGSMSQSRREACFWQIANHCHLGGVVPRADCIIVNGSSERAAISLLGSGWKSLDERKRDPGSKVVEILTPYLNDGQIHRWSCLEYVVGSTDSHGANILVSNGGSVALIDHGASFAGNHWDVPHDTKSWIPAYLRFFAPEFDFKKLTPPERLKHMPRLGQYEDAVLKRWLMDELKPSMVEHLLRKYGADEVIVKACLDRLHELRGAAQDPRVNLSEFSNGLWAGTVVKVSLFEPV
jgi:GNAT superfamily N-acetyltransferase